MSKALDMMTASEIKKAYDKEYAISSAICSEFIQAGRGGERPSEIRHQTDELSLRHTAAAERFFAIVNEMEARKRWHGGTQRIIRRAS